MGYEGHKNKRLLSNLQGSSLLQKMQSTHFISSISSSCFLRSSLKLARCASFSARDCCVEASRALVASNSCLVLSSAFLNSSNWSKDEWSGYNCYLKMKSLIEADRFDRKQNNHAFRNVNTNAHPYGCRSIASYKVCIQGQHAQVHTPIFNPHSDYTAQQIAHYLMLRMFCSWKKQVRMLANLYQQNYNICIGN